MEPKEPTVRSTAARKPESSTNLVEHVLLLHRVQGHFDFIRLEMRRQAPPTFYDVWEVAWSADAASREEDHPVADNLMVRKQIQSADQVARPLEESSEDSVLRREMGLLLNKEVERLCSEGFTIKEDTRRIRR